MKWFFFSDFIVSFVCFQLILDRIYKGVYDKVSKSSAFNKALFEFAFNYKKVWMKRGFTTPLIDRLVFRRTRQLMGGRLRLILTGGAPLSPDTHELIKICLCDLVIQGYGLTETCSCATVMDYYDRTTGRAGNPATVCDIRLVDWDEGNYRVTDKPFPRGEIVIGMYACCLLLLFLNVVFPLIGVL